MELPKDFRPDFPGLAEALLEMPVVSIRRNRAKTHTYALGADTVPWCDQGLYLSGRPQFTFDPALHQGLYYVQDASSMIYSHIVRRLVSSDGPVAYLDACAAPGGKTTAAIDALPEGSLVVANEYVPARAVTLKENLIKWGCPSAVVTRGDTARLRRLPGVFDIVAADVPCSGEGMFRKDPEAVRQWSPALVDECVSRQRVIIDNIWDSIKPGGFLIYSTCTFNRPENEDMVRWILDNYDAVSVPLGFDPGWGVVECDFCHHFLPGRVRGEGLTVAVLRKGGSGQSMRSASRPVKESVADRRLTDSCRSWVTSSRDYHFDVAGTSVRAFPRRWMPLLGQIEKHLEVISRGVEIASVKGRDLIPTQSLAMSAAYARGAFPEYAVDYPVAVAYLRRESVSLPSDAPRGLLLLTFSSVPGQAPMPLGFVKNLGNRANNLYPPEWRILSTHIPDNPPQVLP